MNYNRENIVNDSIAITLGSDYGRLSRFKSILDKRFKGLSFNRHRCDLNINIWKLDGEVYLDIGIRTEIINNKIYIYLPFLIAKEDISDLGLKICNDQKLLRAIFNNSNYSSSPVRFNPSIFNIKLACNNHCGTYSTNSAKDPDFFFYCLSSEDYNIEKLNEENRNGTKISFDLKGLKNIFKDKSVVKELLQPKLKYYCELKSQYAGQNERLILNENDNFYFPYYIRFRVTVKNPSSILISKSLSNDLLQAAFSQTDLINIKINELRNLPLKIQEYMISHNDAIWPEFKSIHLFFMADYKTTIEEKTEMFNARIVEESLWTSYVPTSIEKSPLIAYHWKVKPKNENQTNQFNLFLITRYPRIDGERITIYTSIIILLGCIASFIISFFSGSFINSGNPVGQFYNFSCYKYILMGILMIWAICTTKFIIVPKINSNFKA